MTSPVGASWLRTPIRVRWPQAVVLPRRACLLALTLHACAAPSIDIPSEDASVASCDGATPSGTRAGSADGDDGGYGAGGSGAEAPTGPGTDAAQLMRAARFSEEPGGTTAARPAPGWCPDAPRVEHCSNRIDDDCDGFTDEFLPDPCEAQCLDGSAHLGCDIAEGRLVCLTDDYCMCALPYSKVGCGDGVVSDDEQCDPTAPEAVLGMTCTAECTHPLFVWCGDRGDGSACLPGTRCNAWVGACLPFIGDYYPRCPALPVEKARAIDPDPACQAEEATGTPDDDLEFYPMVEVDGECRISCSGDDQCPSGLPSCYMGFCVVG